MASEMSSMDDEASKKPRTFNPLEAQKKGKERTIRWVSYDGILSKKEDVSSPEEVMADVDTVLKGKGGNFQELSLRDPGTFKAGELRLHIGLWEKILDDYDDKGKVMEWVRSGVNVEKFSQHFKGEYKGVSYNSRLPPRRKFRNHESCYCDSEKQRFVTDTLLEYLESGAFRVWGKVGEGSPPKLVLPMKVEPAKPRLCIDARYLNLWMKDNPKSFSLESLDVVPDFVYKDSFMSKIDDKSAYQHILLTENSEEYFGIEWEGWWLVCRTLPFGWKNGSYVYQTIGLGATHFFRSRGIACSLYIDDRLNGELFTKEGRWSLPIAEREQNFSCQAAKAALYVVCKVLVNLGYFLGLEKCIFDPSTSFVHLGMLIDSTTQSFSVPKEKRDKFAKLREEILKNESCSDPLQSLKKLRGKCLWFSKAFPLGKLFIGEMSAATNVQPHGRLAQNLCEELEFWRFLDNREDSITWTREKTVRVSLYLSSPVRWTIHLPSGDQKYDGQLDCEQPIAVLGIQAVKSVLEKLPSDLRDCEVKIGVKSNEVINEWKSGRLNDSQLKNEIFGLAISRNILVEMDFMNDKPSTAGFRKSDAMLSPSCWETVQWEFGGPEGHNSDLMSLDDNCQKDKHGHPLRHFTPYPTPDSAGVDVFTQDLSKCDGEANNAYVYPPFYLIPKLLRYFMSQGAVVTMVVPKFSPLPPWWPIINSLARKKMRLADRGDRNALLYPTEGAWFPSDSSMELWAFRVDGKRGKSI